MAANDVEAILLTGGSSRRMGSNKATLQVKGEPVAERLAGLLAATCKSVTILGPGGLEDAQPGAGPLAALAAYRPKSSWVFVASCDLPLFDQRLVDLFLRSAEAVEAVLPEIEGRVQPLCGLYAASAFAKAKALVELGSKRIMSWVDGLSPVIIGGEALAAAGLDPNCVRGANTPEEWRALLRE